MKLLKPPNLNTAGGTIVEPPERRLFCRARRRFKLRENKPGKKVSGRGFREMRDRLRSIGSAGRFDGPA
jgi:hypothetical protein